MKRRSLATVLSLACHRLGFPCPSLRFPPFGLCEGLLCLGLSKGQFLHGGNGSFRPGVSVNSGRDESIGEWLARKARPSKPETTGCGVSPDEKIEWTPELLADSIHKQESIGAALNLFSWAKRARQELSHSAVVYHAIIERVGKAKMFTVAWRLLEEMRENGVELSAETFLIIIESFRSAESVVSALQTLDRMPEFGVKPSIEIFSLLLNTALDTNRHRVALKLYKQLLNDGLSADTSSINRLIQGLCEGGELVHAKSLYHNASKTEKRILQVNTYESLIKAFSNAGKVSEAFSFLDSMKDRGIKPTTYSFNLIISAACRSRYMRFAHNMYKLMLELDCPPNIVTYNILMDGYFKARQSGMSISIFRQMQEAGITPDEFTDRIMLLGLSESGKLSKALRYFEAMREEGRPIRTDICNAILHGLCSLSMTKAKEFFLRMKHGGLCVPDEYSYTTMMHGFRKADRLWDAEELFDEMKQMGIMPNEVSYYTLIAGYIRSEQIRTALKLLDEFLCSDLKISVLTCKNLMITLNRAELFDQSLQICKYMMDRKIPINSDSLATLTKALCKRGRILESQRLLKDLGNNGCLDEPYVPIFQEDRDVCLF